MILYNNALILVNMRSDHHVCERSAERKEVLR